MTRPAVWSPLATRDPAPGDPDEIDRAASRYRATADEIERQVAVLQSLSIPPGWDSEAARRFAGKAGEVVYRLRLAHGRYTEASRHLYSWATALRDAQTETLAALQDAVEAEKRKVANRTSPLASVAEPTLEQQFAARTQQRLYEDAGDDLAAARRRAGRATDRLDDDARRVARAIRDAGKDDAQDASVLFGLLGPGGKPFQAWVARWFWNRRGAWERGAKIPGHWLERLPGLPWAVDEGHELAEGMRDQSPGEQLVWWNSLKDAQREALTFAYPELVLGLPGLPIGTLATARAQFVVQQGSEVVDRVMAERYGVEVGLGVVKVGADVGATTITMADGRTTRVTIYLEGDLGREFGSDQSGAKVGIEGGVSATYEFASPESAQQFLDGLKTSLRPGEDSPTEYLGWHRAELLGRTAELGVAGSTKVEIGGEKVQLAGRIGGSIDLDTGSKTAYVGLSAESSSSTHHAGIDGRMELHIDRAGNVTGATLSGSASVSSGAEASVLVKDLSGQSLNTFGISGGARVSFAAEIDPRDPLVQQDLRRLVRDPDDTAALSRLFARSEASVSVATTAQESFSAGAKAGGIGVTVDGERSTSDAVLSFVKPGNGPWVEIGVR